MKYHNGKTTMEIPIMILEDPIRPEAYLERKKPLIPIMKIITPFNRLQGKFLLDNLTSPKVNLNV